MTETMTPVIPPVPAVACPSWCIQCDDNGEDADGRRLTSHDGETMKIPLSCGRVGDHSGDMAVYLSGTNGRAPFIGLARDDQWAELTTEEAEHLAGILTSLVDQARTAELRY